MSNHASRSVHQVDKKLLDLRAPDEHSDKAGVGSSKARLSAFSRDQDKFVTEWSYCPPMEEAEDNPSQSEDQQ